MNRAALATLLLLSNGVAQAQTTYKVGDAWTPQGRPALVVEDFTQGFAGWVSNDTNYRWHTQPLAASPSGVQVYDNILSGNTTWTLHANCLGAWDADNTSALPASTGTMPCMDITAHYVNGAWHSGVIASTNPDGSAISANPSGALGNRFIVEVLARLPDAYSGQVKAGFTPAIWINNAKSAGGCTEEEDVVEDFGLFEGGNQYHFLHHHCWLNGVDQADTSTSIMDSYTNLGQPNEVDSITNWSWWVLDESDPKQIVWTRNGKVMMVVPRDPNNGDVRADLMIANQVGCCGSPPPSDTTSTATLEVAAIVIR